VWFVDRLDGGMGEMVVVWVADYNSINDWDVFNIARYRCVSLGAQPGQRRASIFEDWIEEDA
jgi:hypothetical protein